MGGGGGGGGGGEHEGSDCMGHYSSNIRQVERSSLIRKNTPGLYLYLFFFHCQSLHPGVGGNMDL